MTFTASNGAQVVLTNAGLTGYVLAEGEEHLATAYLDFDQMKAWREHAQHERDAELGRWRWPENPDYVVYAAGVKTRVRVLRETGMANLEWVDRGDERNYEFCHAARAYFEAHTEPKPWTSAKPGEVWVLTVNGEEIACTVNHNPDFIPVSHRRWASIARGSEVIETARRIYPESES